MCIKSKIIYAILLLIFILTPIFSGKASRIDELNSLIDDKRGGLNSLKKDIDKYEKELSQTKKAADNLSTTLDRLDTTRLKLGKDIDVTKIKIGSANLNIEKLDIEINTTKDKIEKNKEVIINTMQLLREKEEKSLVEVFFLHDTLSSFWIDITNLEALQKSVTVTLNKLHENKNELETQNVKEKGYKNNLSNLKNQLVDQKTVADIARVEKNKLLTKTKNKQTEYEKLLEEKRKAKKQFELDLIQYEQELKEVLDPGSIPVARSGVISWPVHSKIFITQYYGNTPFATKNPSVYNGQGHNGIDIGVPLGTPVYASRNGTVIGYGDTDNTCPNASYGKWILVEHDNGLSTLYAHLSLVSKKSGISVTKDTILGYSGSTGYSTGPHLHFTVFASDAVNVGSLTSRVCVGAKYTIPLLTKTGGYLNPLSYLSEIK